MWTNENRCRYDRSKLRSPSDLTVEETVRLLPLGLAQEDAVELLAQRSDPARARLEPRPHPIFRQGVGCLHHT